jgi:hypothetical protein
VAPKRRRLSRNGGDFDVSIEPDCYVMHFAAAVAAPA